MNNKRLKSLDILRGLDLWLLVFIGPIAYAFCNVAEGPFRDFLKIQTEHASWTGFTTWDIIMPLFIFMSGATIPFSMARFREGIRPDRKFWTKLARRVFLLFFIGWIVQGNLLELQWHLFHPFANTLQAIAVSYAAVAIVFAYRGIRQLIIFTAICFSAYFLAFALAGQFNPDFQDNIAMWIDKAILGSHRDGVTWNPDGSWDYDIHYRYTWILSSLNFIVTSALGCFSGHILRNWASSGTKRAVFILTLGTAFLVSGLLLDYIFPINKRIWNSSMTLFSGGICCILISVVYYIVDVKEKGKGLGWLEYYGKNSILAYFIGETVSFSSISVSLLHGFGPILGDWYPVLISTSNGAILFLILMFLHKKNIFLKV